MKHIKALSLLLAFAFSLAMAQEEVVPLEILEETPEYRVIRHLAGETQIPAKPQRIAALHDAISEPLVAMGVKPVGAASYDPAFPSFLRSQLEGALYLGNNLEPNVEATLAAEPDLIIMAFDERVDRAFYDQLSLIAPTVLLANGFSNIRQGLRDLGTVLGMSEEAEEAVSGYDQDIAQARETLQHIMEGQTIALIRLQGRDMRLVGNGEFGGPVIYNDLGLEPAAIVRSLAWGENYAPISFETIPEIQADHLFFFVDNQDTEGRELLRELEQSPLWRNLPAVQAGNAYPVDYNTWVWNGIIGNPLVIEQAIAALTDEDE